MLQWCIGDFYQTSSIQNLWIFKLKTNALNILGTNFWQGNMKCYELKQVMHQNDLEFINIINRFQISLHIFETINFIKKIVWEHHQ
jgi:hypothetical protein